MTAVGRATDAEALTRTALFRAWKAQETRTHWGSNAKNYQATDFRIMEGGADEVGSIGFNQVKYVYRYGQAHLRCQALEAYNLYEPIDNLRAMVAFVTAPPIDENNIPIDENSICAKTMHRAFAANGVWRTMTRERETLRGYLNAEGNLVAIAEGRVDDAYERLMKGIAGYNGQTDINVGGTDRTWAHVLRVAHTTEMGNFRSNRRYAMQIRTRFGLEGRAYIWSGGQHPPGHPRAGQDWCFEYGEQEWMNPEFRVRNRDGTERPARFDDYLNRASTNATHQVPCQ